MPQFHPKPFFNPYIYVTQKQIMDEPISISKVPTTKPSFIQAPTPVVAPTSKPTFATEIIDLPSEGYFYPVNSPLSSGRIEIKFMTAREEDILSSQNLIKKGIVLDELLKALIVNPDIKLDDILVGDKNAIFIAARRLAYGAAYPVKIKCPECSAESNINVNLSELKNRPFDFTGFTKGNNSFEFVLPISKKKVTYRLMTHRDEQAIDAELKSLARLNKDAASPEMTTRLKYMIVAIDGNDDRAIIKKAVDDMLSRDSSELRKHVRSNNPDIDMTFNFVCPKCGHEERMGVPVGVDFFWPNSGI